MQAWKGHTTRGQNYRKESSLQHHDWIGDVFWPWCRLGEECATRWRSAEASARQSVKGVLLSVSNCTLITSLNAFLSLEGGTTYYGDVAFFGKPKGDILQDFSTKRMWSAYLLRTFTCAFNGEIEALKRTCNGIVHDIDITSLKQNF